MLATRLLSASTTLVPNKVAYSLFPWFYGNSPVADALAGYSVAVSETGVLVVGSPNFNSATTNNGAFGTYIINSGGTYNYTSAVPPFNPNATYAPSGGANMGRSVSISGDATKIVVGAPTLTTSPYTQNGGAYYYTYSSATNSFSYVRTVIGNTPQSSSLCGETVKLALNGSAAVVASRGYSSSPNTGNGLVWVYSGDLSTYYDDLTASDKANGDQFGTSVDLSANGRTIIVGSPYNSSGGFTANGAAYVFDDPTGFSNNWTQYAKLVPSDPANNAFFGKTVSLSQDGNFAFVGAPSRSGTNYTGAVYVFARTPGTLNTWFQLQRITPFYSTYDFGDGLCNSVNGRILLIGSSSDYASWGRVDAYTYSGGSWSFKYYYSPASSQAQSTGFGPYLAMPQKGGYFVAGAPFYDFSAQSTGAVFVYS